MSRRWRAPFRVYKRGDGWLLQRNHIIVPPVTIGRFATPGEAIDHAYRNWPWWP